MLHSKRACRNDVGSHDTTRLGSCTAHEGHKGLTAFGEYPPSLVIECWLQVLRSCTSLPHVCCLYKYKQSSCECKIKHLAAQFWLSVFYLTYHGEMCCLMCFINGSMSSKQCYMLLLHKTYRLIRRQATYNLIDEQIFMKWSLHIRHETQDINSTQKQIP